MQIQKRRRIKNCFITYSGTWDGGGAQVHNIISILVFAKRFNLTYLHKPIMNVEHFSGDRDKWSENWEEHFNLGICETQYPKDADLKFSVISKKFPVLIQKKRNTIFEVINCQAFCNSFPEYYRDVISELIPKRCEIKLVNSLSSQKMKLCLHIRRGDVGPILQGTRFTPNEYILKALNLVTGILNRKGKPWYLIIVSQGSSDDFIMFERFGPYFYLNEDVFATFEQMVNADILITAKSSFSYVAALYNKNVIIYEPFWHKPMHHWISLSESPNKFSNLIMNSL